MPKKKKKTQLDCITGSHHLYDWHPNKDPFIYISFNAQTLHNAYGTLPHVRLMLRNQPLMELDKESEREVKNFIDINFRMWGVRFLEEGKINVSEKNVVFLLHKHPQSENQNGLTITDPAESENKFKLVFMPTLSSPKLNNSHKYVYLHELMHAVAGAKHPINRVQIDHPPYCPEITCEDSVMAYVPEDCPRVQEVERKLLGPKKVSIHTTDPSEQKIIAKIFTAFPNTLSPLDTQLLDSAHKRREENKEVLSGKNKRRASTRRIDLFEQTTSFGAYVEAYKNEKQAALVPKEEELGGFLNWCRKLPASLGDWMVNALIHIATEAVEAGGPGYGPQKMPNELFQTENRKFSNSQAQCSLFSLRLYTNTTIVTHSLR